jgi:Ca2+-binding EF-hand superfamily protein
MKQRFCTKQAFEQIDQDSDSLLRTSEIRDFFAHHGFYATERELQGLMLRLNPNKEQKVNLD